MTNPDRVFQVVITGDSIAPEARDLLSEKCRLVFPGLTLNRKLLPKGSPKSMRTP